MSTSSTYRPKAKKNATFPVKLYTLLELCDGSSPSLERYPDGSSIVAWSSHGRSFEIRDEDRFMDEISPKFFRLTTISSFYRQLHLWASAVSRRALTSAAGKFVADWPSTSMEEVELTISFISILQVFASVPSWPARAPQGHEESQVQARDRDGARKDAPRARPPSASSTHWLGKRPDQPSRASAAI